MAIEQKMHCSICLWVGMSTGNCPICCRSAELVIEPPTLEQIRMVVREELQAVIMKPPVFDASTITSEELTERLNNWKSQVHFTHNELTPEQKRSIVEDVKKALSRDARISGGGRIA